MLRFRTTFDCIVRDQVGTNNDSHFLRPQVTCLFSKPTALHAHLIALKNSRTAIQRFSGIGAAGQSQDVYGVGARLAF